MNLLLDTQAFVWWYEGNRKLGRLARAAIEADARTVSLSVASVWELAVKSRAGRLRTREPVHHWVPTTIAAGRFDALAIRLEHTLAVADLPDHHDDPFDRLLIVQAQMEHLTIVTADTAFDAYDVPVLDARA